MTTMTTNKWVKGFTPISEITDDHLMQLAGKEVIVRLMSGSVGSLIQYDPVFQRGTVRFHYPETIEIQREDIVSVNTAQ